jgi:uncharacterized protein YndB with AHSA1/START domain
MAHPFELTEEITLDATPEQVWAAIASGPGVDSWLMGSNEIAGHVGGRNRMSLLGFANESTTTAWEPGRRYAFRSDDNPDGTFMAFEYLIEGRDGGATVLRYVHSGMLGDDWEAEYDGLRKGTMMYLLKLRAYLSHFEGRATTYTLFLPGAPVADQATVWSAFLDVFGLTKPEGVARVAVEGLPPVEGVVEFASEPVYLGVRTPSGMYALIHGYRDAVVVAYHDFGSGLDEGTVAAAWQDWLTSTFSPAS